MREESQPDKKKKIQELENMESGVKSLMGIKIDKAELEIEIGDTQYLIDTNTVVAQKVAQEDMARLQHLLKENKKKLATSSEQGKSKKKLTARTRIQNLQKLICALKAGIASPPSRNDQ